ncbi:hypothetical protein Ahy_A08g038396 [Arachis hypogaea]|uniref:Reverse transcriptase domain-containing protein n=1 Tax=Arachis hypogaea TaxID=3818 RepID=A0A445BTH7_ARAHY|nr:hypothetical protein Ahy_A08g038396 [Arachis hypogaea]
MKQIDGTPRPHFDLKIKTSIYDKPTKAVALLDTGSCATVLRPHVLPKEMWAPISKTFTAANSQITWLRVLGSYLPDKDVLFGFDAFFRTHGLHIKPTGLTYKGQFLPFLGMQSILEIQEAPEEYREIQQLLISACCDSHDQFNHPAPLWKNPEFYVRLPFKKNEDINPTKATHSGMNPEDLKLARAECAALLVQGLIEPTKSNWACQAFYVEKRAEQNRGKKRLVIDYKPLNVFLQDDKFPLPKISVTTQRLSGAKIFSKFDLKAGFWQIGLHPEDRYKTAFCIPEAQYQWTVMPFGLKVAPSLFQKAMTKIFEPILHSTLIYIDDILLFSKDNEAHKALLAQFTQIIKDRGIMLSAKKSSIAKKRIEFLGMVFEDGFFQPGEHIAKGLINFPDENMTVKQVQQFLGIVNYIRDFIPDVTKHTSQLSKLLQKKPPPWGPEQTTAVKTLKKIAQDPPPLKIPNTGKRILQTDASDEFWGAVLLEEIDGTRHYCAHASGNFKESEKHYHATYKEILAVKRGIEKFNFHLSSYHFTVEMDNTSFPSMLEIKKKILPDSQLLRWKDWFSRYKFEVRHIKGHQNTLADFLSRPTKEPPPKPIEPPPKPIHYICTMSTHNPSYTIPFPDCPLYNNPYRRKIGPFPFKAKPQTGFQIACLARQTLFYWLHQLLIITQICPNPKYFDMDTPFCTIPIIQGPIPEEMMWYIWALSSLYPCAIIIPLFPVYHILCNRTEAQSHLVRLFAMYAPLGAWRGMLYNMIEQHQLWDKPSRTKRKFCCFVTLQRDYFTECKAHTVNAHTMNKVDIVGYSTIWPTDEKTVLNALAKYLCKLWQPGLFGERDVIEGLPFQSEVPPITLQEFQSRFITSGIINQFGQYSFYAPRDQPSTSTHVPNRNSEEDLNSEDLGGRVYALPPSPTRADAGIADDVEGPKSDPYDPYLQDAQDPNEGNTEDPFLYLGTTNPASDSSFSDGDGTLPEDYFKPSLY